MIYLLLIAGAAFLVLSGYAKLEHARADKLDQQVIAQAETIKQKDAQLGEYVMTIEKAKADADRQNAAIEQLARDKRAMAAAGAAARAANDRVAAIADAKIRAELARKQPPGDACLSACQLLRQPL